MSGRRRARTSPASDTQLLFADQGQAEAGGANGRDGASAGAGPSAAGRISSGAPPGDPFVADVVAGIDEAGLGPLLGPLAIGYSAFRVPRGSHDLWTPLRAVCTDDVDDDRQRLVVADSKLVFTRNPRGERRLERTALSFLTLRDSHAGCPPTARDVLERLDRDVPSADEDSQRAAGVTNGAIRAEPWLPHLDRDVPVHGGREEIDAAAVNLLEGLSRESIELTRAGARLVSAAALNASFDETCNKSVTHWRATRTVLTHLWRAHADQGLDLAVDRQGGRMRYARLLAETFEQASIYIVRETPPLSVYLVLESSGDSAAAPNREPGQLGHAACPSARPIRRMRITFAERAESASFAVALASCLAKYARETCMNAFNRYFESLQPGLKPTAGYVTDGRRWLADAAPAIERSGLERRALVRER